ncbi:glycoside hydrolase family 3 C-terminal domain-containing protein [Diplocloster modestus]|uniref:Glycoside hydrolase family 3 C-terminal domain-containing protein n=1 Tax=Diplocloster modestus TaxID=2850322 RepID=A0ABS6KEF2_9FIRM|nr:glycoside hydrolase family 3 C-terminal domain-containing protein [Diplocloster modestus]MBU9728890.1 glycoside hydrolase family 3 C-terminal domain-containing protein [Diplocloster modestus]
MNKNREAIQKIISKMSLEEKAGLCVGKDFWHIRNIEELGIPPMILTDGPHGIRKQAGAADQLTLGISETAVCFPAGCAIASSFDPAVSELVGEELGKLAKTMDIGVVLGPAINMKRSPLCGRNFEYYSEDPLVAGTMGAGAVRGLQKQNVSACPKHFAANNQELYRQTSNSRVDEQTLREIYLAAFEKVVKDAGPWSIMCSYNRVNGTYSCENPLLLTGILRDEWGFDGAVVTDWGACDDPVESLRAGLDLCMPGPGKDLVNQIRSAVEDGRLAEEILNQAVENILKLVSRTVAMENTTSGGFDFEAGHAAAKEVELEAAVLLKNQDAVLPLKEQEKIVFIGYYAENPRYQGGGSSHVNSYKVTSVLDAVTDLENLTYCQGYIEEPEKGQEAEEERLLQEALEAAEKADKAVVFAGLPDSWETETLDRTRMDIPENQNRLIKKIAEVQKNTVVVLHNGSPVEMPWVHQVKGILELYLGGEAVGAAAADLLFGRANPSGKLAETFPVSIKDNPTYPYYGVEKNDVLYREGRLIGYRYYETIQKQVLFPFGYGLSYTSFAYDNLQLDSTRMRDNEELVVKVDVANTGAMEGKEVVQVYVAPCHSSEVRPARELRAFKKIKLKPEERKTVTFTLHKRAFAEWNTDIRGWYVPEGNYKVQIGTSARDILLERKIYVQCTSLMKPHFTVNTPMGDLYAHPVAAPMITKAMKTLMGNRRNRLESEEKTDESGALTKDAMAASAAAMPLRAMVALGFDVTLKQVQEVIDEINKAVENG